jgi:hypothetical protein
MKVTKVEPLITTGSRRLRGVIRVGVALSVTFGSLC